MLKNINFGDVDAKNEILKQNRGNTKYFFESYSIPERIDIEEILNGSKFFISGLKGTGKTALIRYVHNEAVKKKFQSELILFKSHITEDDKQTLSNNSGYNIISTEKSNIFVQDFKESWKWLLIQRISTLIKKSEHNCDISKKLYQLTGIEKSSIKNSIGSLFSSIKSGNINVSAEAFGVAVGLGLEVENDHKEKKLNLSDVNRACIKIIHNIKVKDPIYLFLDELELFHETSDQFDRDRRIIRDLIYGISFINAECSEHRTKIFVCSTLRNEVLHSVLELGHEISKDIDDYSIRLDWSDGKQSINHPLMKLIQRKISVSTGIDESDVWRKIFPDRINNQRFYDFILNSSYYRPRDIVRLLRVARDFRDTDTMFSTEHFDRTSTEYSKQTWLEITEELLAVYSSAEISAFQRLFLGFNTHFFKQDLTTRVKDKYRDDRIISETFQRHESAKILEDLYRIGVIGNDFIVRDAHGHTRRRYRWIFRGNTTLNDSERMTFHKSLWKHLSLSETPYVKN